MSNTQLELYDTPEQKRDKYVAYIERNIKKFEFYCTQSEYPFVAETLKRIRADNGIETNSDVFMFLLKNYNEDKENEKHTVKKKEGVRKPDRKRTKRE